METLGVAPSERSCDPWPPTPSQCHDAVDIVVLLVDFRCSHTRSVRAGARCLATVDHMKVPGAGRVLREGRKSGNCCASWCHLMHRHEL